MYGVIIIQSSAKTKTKVTFIYIETYTICIVSKQIQNTELNLKIKISQGNSVVVVRFNSLLITLNVAKSTIKVPYESFTISDVKSFFIISLK